MDQKRYQSEIERCHLKYCETLLDDFIEGKLTKQYFIHLYYNALIPLSQNYRFPIPDRVKNAVKKLDSDE